MQEQTTSSIQTTTPISPHQQHPIQVQVWHQQFANLRYPTPVARSMKKGKGRQTKAHPTSLHKKGKKKLSIHEWGAYISDYDTDSEADMSQHNTPVPSQYPSRAASPSAQASTSPAAQFTSALTGAFGAPTSTTAPSGAHGTFSLQAFIRR